MLDRHMMSINLRTHLHLIMRSCKTFFLRLLKTISSTPAASVPLPLQCCNIAATAVKKMSHVRTKTSFSHTHLRYLAHVYIVTWSHHYRTRTFTLCTRRIHPTLRIFTTGYHTLHSKLYQGPPRCRHKISLSAARPVPTWLTVVNKTYSSMAGRSGSEPQPPWKILFLGTDVFALKHLEALNENRLDSKKTIVDKIDVVISTEKCAVRRYAVAAGLSILKWPISDLSQQYDVAIIVSFGHLIPSRVIRMFPCGMLNVHPSCLPRWRGASPIIHTILSGDKTTAISVMKIQPKRFDIGPILLKQNYPVPDGATSIQLMELLVEKGPPLLLQVLENLANIPAVPQPVLPNTPVAHKLSVHNARVNWAGQTAAHIDRQYRGLSEIYNLRSMWKEQHVRLLDMVLPSVMQERSIREKLCDVFTSHPPAGTPYFHRSSGILSISCKDGWVGFQRIVIKKPMTVAAFYNGYLSKAENQGVVFTSLPNGLDDYWGQP